MSFQNFSSYVLRGVPKQTSRPSGYLLNMYTYVRFITKPYPTIAKIWYKNVVGHFSRISENIF